MLLDFFCHGVPSMLMWEKYVAWAEKKVGKLTSVSWRNKSTGWHDSWAMVMEGKKSLTSRLSQGDMFYRLFLSDTCLGKLVMKNASSSMTVHRPISVSVTYGVRHTQRMKKVSAQL